MTNASLIGRTLAGYRILEVIGEGGMGVVYRAEHSTIGKQAAIKVLQRHYAHMPDVLARFIREAKAVNDIRHENVIDILGFDHTEDKEPYILMEFLEGQSLSNALEKEAPFSTERSVHVGLQISSALFAAHEQGIIHRDLKGDNVFLTKKRAKKDYVKLFDFGIAKLLHGGLQESGHTRTGAFVGTPICTAPEQADGGTVDARTDIYAFGVLLHQMATGAPPFYDKNPHLLIALHLTAPVAPPREKNPSISPALEAIIVKCLAKKPKDRFSSMREVAQALAAITKKNLTDYCFPEETQIKAAPLPDRSDNTAVDIRVESTQITPAPDRLQLDAKATPPLPIPLPKETTDSIPAGESFEPLPQKANNNRLIKIAALLLIPLSVGVIALFSLGGGSPSTSTQPPKAAPVVVETPATQAGTTQPATLTSIEENPTPIEDPIKPTKTTNPKVKTNACKGPDCPPKKTEDKKIEDKTKTGFTPTIPFQ
jgi:serine/threonine protein kinase